MKKYTFLILLVLLLVGCTNTIKISSKDVITMKDNSITLLKEDYNKLLSYVNHLSFSKRKEDIKKGNSLSITTNDTIHLLQISSDHKIKYQINKETYYSGNKKTVKKMEEYLDKLKKEYLNRDFFQVSELKEYKENDQDMLVKIDNVPQYFLLTSKQKITQFEIHKVELKEGLYHDIDLIYEQDKIDKNTKIVIRMNPQKDYFRYRISFINKYGLSVSIIPTYDIERESGALQYLTDFKYQK